MDENVERGEPAEPFVGRMQVKRKTERKREGRRDREREEKGLCCLGNK